MIGEYAHLVKVVVLALLGLLVACAVATSGWHFGSVAGEAERRELVDRIAAKDSALRRASDSLRGAAGALRAQQKANDERIAAERRQRRIAEEAREVALEAEERQWRRAEGFRLQVRNAGERPACAALLATNVRELCGL